ncbi:hypothetical protein H9660_09720 [Clostridium sp. Sa3CUN1]|uniref:Uncharacterized protein n=1 Tax=Clostridium gallinarum TaxID=2762246 RepID=A0ABR8Q4S5_9CLOT|nr:hypothetical protein [Clostridium gallinarum]MBD7915426.1 hypothetical protein [Clostridium gallinarum]
MSKDKVDISIQTTFKAINKNINLWNRRRVELKNTDNNKVNSRIDYWINKDDIYIKYYNFSTFSGRLIISLNMDKLFKKNNSDLSTVIGFNNLKDYLEDKLGEIIDFTEISDIKSWGVNREETFIDIVVPTYMAEALFEVLLKTKSNRKKIDDEYANRETIYYHSGANRKKSKCLYKVYDKVKESIYRGNSIEVPCNNTLIRFEAKNGRTKIVRVIRNIRKDIINKNNAADDVFININPILNNCIKLKFNIYNDYVLKGSPHLRYDTLNLWSIYDNKYKFYNNNVEYSTVLTNNLSSEATLLDTCDIRYQEKSLIDFMKDIQMDKEKLTREQLLESIDVIFNTNKTRETAKQVVRYLNGEIENPPINIRSIVKYKKTILEFGVHYIYSKVYIPAIDIDCFKQCILSNKRLELVS